MQKVIAAVSTLFLLACSGAFATQIDGNGKEIPGQSAGASALNSETIKQPVFVFCPHVEGRGAWSLYIEFDKANPTKALALGLEELPGKNSKELSYKGVLAAQKDLTTPRTQLAHLNAKDFASGLLNVQENNMLSIKVVETPDGLKLTVDARTSLDDHFVVGGPEGTHGDLVIQYSSLYKCWQTKARKLENIEGRNVVGKYNMTLSGIIFNAGSTRVSRICAVDEFGSPVIMMDR